MAFLYPDLSTSLVGSFRDGQMLVAREARLHGLHCRSVLTITRKGMFFLL